MKKFKDIDVAKGSQLYEAMELKDAKERKKQTEKIYKEVKANAVKLYGEEDYHWFINWNPSCPETNVKVYTKHTDMEDTLGACGN